MIKNKILLLFFIVFVCCKKDSKKDVFVKDKLNVKIGEQETVLNSLPDEIANKTWIYLSKLPEYNTYVNILDYDAYHSLKTEKNTLHTVLDVYEGYHFEIDFKSVKVIGNTFRIDFENPEIDYANFKWIDKSKGIGEWEVRYLRYCDGLDSVIVNKSVMRKFVTPENFPEVQKSTLVLEKEKNIDNKYQKVSNLPFLGMFSCNKESSDSRVKFINEEQKIYGEKGIVKEVQSYQAVITLDEAINIGCSLAKIKNSNNKFVFLFKYTTDTKYHPKDKLFFSETDPIAEMEVLEDKTIKIKWFGFYNRKTKKYEDYGNYGWKDNCNNVLMKIEE